MKNSIFLPIFYLIMTNTVLQANAQDKQITAAIFNSGFPIAHDTYNAISIASDGNVYYVLSSLSIDTGGMMYAYNPKTGQIKLCGDITEAAGEKEKKSVSQGKSHARFYEANGKLYFSTHAGYYSMVDGMEKMGIPPAGYKPYPGGFFLSYDLKTGHFENLGVAPHQEGVLTMNMDTRRGMLYGITWPTGYFVTLDIATNKMTNLGPVSGEGENGAGSNYRTLCRSIAINEDNGDVYLTNSEGDILKYTAGATGFQKCEENMRKDYFGLYDPSSPGHMGYNWRQIEWSPIEKCFYGVHGNSGYLFKFDPAADRITVIDRITSETSRASGMFDQFSYGYLGFTFGPDQRTLYYLTGAPIYENGELVRGKDKTAKGEAKGLENLHLITYDTRNNVYKDHGAIFYPDGQRPLYVNSIAVAKDGTVYTLARITENGTTRTDLVKIPAPSLKKK